MSPLIACGVGVLPLLRDGFGMGHDWLLELVRIAEFHFAVLDGQLPPFWAPDLYGGLGSPIFLFYAPLYLAISSALVPFAGSVTGAATGAIVLFSIAGAVLVWRFIRRVCPEFPAAARIGVVLYALHPYLLTDKWIRNANAEFAALSLLPGVLMGATARKRQSAFWWTSISLAGVILAHNITALTAIALAIAVPIFVHRNLRTLIPIYGAILVALTLTAFFWVPALAFQPLIRSEDLLTGKFDFHGQFPKITSFFWPSAFYSGGWLTIVLLAVILLVPVTDLCARRITRALGIAAIVFIFLMLRVSTSVWETLPLLRYEQFPWRFMGPLAVVLVIGCGIASTRLPRLRPMWCVEFVTLVVALLNAYPTLRAYEPVPPQVRVEVEQALTPREIQTHNLRATVYDEYLPRSASPVAVHPEEGAILFRRWAFPVWSATVDGQPVPVELGSGGLVAVRVPPGKGQVSLTLLEPPLRKICKGISVLTAAALVCIAITFCLRNLRGDRGSMAGLPSWRLRGKS